MRGPVHFYPTVPKQALINRHWRWQWQWGR